MVEISVAASLRLKTENPSVSLSHCFNSTVAVIVGNALTIRLKEIEVSLQATLSTFSTRTKMGCVFAEMLVYGLFLSITSVELLVCAPVRDV